jgi:hypothetical protein
LSERVPRAASYERYCTIKRDHQPTKLLFIWASATWSNLSTPLDTCDLATSNWTELYDVLSRLESNSCLMSSFGSPGAGPYTGKPTP